MPDPTLGYVSLRYRQWPFEGGEFFTERIRLCNTRAFADCAQRDMSCRNPWTLPRGCAATRMDWRSPGSHRGEAHPMRLAGLPVLEARRDRFRTRIVLDHATPAIGAAMPDCQRCLAFSSTRGGNPAADLPMAATVATVAGCQPTIPPAQRGFERCCAAALRHRASNRPQDGKSTPHGIRPCFAGRPLRFRTIGLEAAWLFAPGHGKRESQYPCASRRCACAQNASGV